MPDRFYLHNSLSFVCVVKDSEAVDPQFPLGQSVWPQNFVVSCFALRFVLQSCIDLLHDSPSVSAVVAAEVFDGLRRVPDLEHAPQAILSANCGQLGKRARSWENPPLRTDPPRRDSPLQLVDDPNAAHCRGLWIR